MTMIKNISKEDRINIRKAGIKLEDIIFFFQEC